jgi:hypothetical protein
MTLSEGWDLVLVLVRAYRACQKILKAHATLLRQQGSPAKGPFAFEINLRVW